MSTHRLQPTSPHATSPTPSRPITPPTSNPHTTNPQIPAPHHTHTASDPTSHNPNEHARSCKGACIGRNTNHRASVHKEEQLMTPSFRFPLLAADKGTVLEFTWRRERRFSANRIPPLPAPSPPLVRVERVGVRGDTTPRVGKMSRRISILCT